MGDCEDIYLEKLPYEPPFDGLSSLRAGYLASSEDMVAPKGERDDVTLRRLVSLARNRNLRYRVRNWSS